MRAAAATRFQTCQLGLIYGVWDARATDSSYIPIAYTVPANDTKQSDYSLVPDEPGPRSSDRINVTVVLQVIRTVI